MEILKKHPSLFWGLMVTIMFLGLGLFGLKFFDTLELKLYDVMMNLRSEPESSSNIVIVDIDNDSIEKLAPFAFGRRCQQNKRGESQGGGSQYYAERAGG